MPRIIIGSFDVQFEGRTITFTSSEDSARIINHIVHDMTTHDSLKKIPAETLIDFLSYPEDLAAGESIVDSEGAVFQAMNEAVDDIARYAEIISPRGLSLDEAIAWQEHGIIPQVFNMRATYRIAIIIFTTGKNVTLSSLQEIADALPDNAWCNSWGHILDNSLGSRIKITVLANIFRYT